MSMLWIGQPTIKLPSGVDPIRVDLSDPTIVPGLWQHSVLHVNSFLKSLNSMLPHKIKM